MESNETVLPRRTAPRILMMVAAVLLFFAYAYLPIRSPRAIFNSPDEMANAYFATLFERDRILHSFEPLNQVAGERIHPRSVAVVENFLVPGSFHGLPVLYGLLSKLFGLGALPFFTSAIAVLAILAWRRLVGAIFGARAGSVAALLVAITPAWWYWTGRGFYHNVLFVSLLIFAAYFFVVKPFRAHFFHQGNPIALSLNRLIDFIDHALAGIALGFAWWVRTSELGWTAVVAIVLLIIARKTIRAREVISFVIATAIAFTPALITNNALYGSPLRTGYTPESSATMLRSIVAEPDSNSVNFVNSINSVIFPFGLHPRTALTNFTRYFVTLPWWMTIVTALSLLWFGHQFFRGNRSREETTLVALFLGVTGWLAAVYGSWVIHDNPNPDAVTVGISYSRYWLAAFFLSTGVSGIALSQWFSKFKNRLAGLLVFSLLVMSLFVGSFRVVFFSADDGLVTIRNTLQSYRAIKEDVLSRTPRESVIVVDHADKIFFPDRRVMGALRDEATVAVLGPLSLRVPLYYYGITLGDEEFKVINEERLRSQSIQMELVTTYSPPVPGGRPESLYQFVKN